MELIGNSIQQPHYTESNQVNKGKTMPTKIVVDCTTGATVEVELTEAEITQQAADAAAAAEAKTIADAEAATKAAEKEAILERLGLTEDELKVVLS
jgi:transcriptional regulator of nitric oxide reductase